MTELQNNNYNLAAIDPNLDKIYREHALAVAQTCVLPIASDADEVQIADVESSEDKSNEVLNPQP